MYIYSFRIFFVFDIYMDTGDSVFQNFFDRLGSNAINFLYVITAALLLYLTYDKWLMAMERTARFFVWLRDCAFPRPLSIENSELVQVIVRTTSDNVTSDVVVSSIRLPSPSSLQVRAPNSHDLSSAASQVSVPIVRGPSSSAVTEAKLTSKDPASDLLTSPKNIPRVDDPGASTSS